jgi:RNA polymerase sigma-70 factor, ECF subfamily
MDESAFTRLYDAHTPALYRLALRMLGGDASAAEDVVQEAWIRAVERMESFRGDSAIRTWLSGFVVRIAQEAMRAPVQLEERDLELMASDDRRLTGAVDRVDLERAIAALPPGFRSVLVLHDVEGRTHDEIADLLGIVVGTSKSQLARARAALRLALT